jgi:S-adenosylmethionine synthetase
MRNLKAFMVCLAVSILLGISAKAQVIDTVYMVAGNHAYIFDFETSEVDKKMPILLNHKIVLDVNHKLHLDLYDKHAGLHKDTMRKLSVTYRDGTKEWIYFASYNEFVLFDGSIVKSVTIGRPYKKG